MDDNQALLDAWGELLSDHRDLVSAYLASIGSPAARSILSSLGYITASITALAAILRLDVDS